jgi:hypothetical protein
MLDSERNGFCMQRPNRAFVGHEALSRMISQNRHWASSVGSQGGAIPASGANLQQLRQLSEYLISGAEMHRLNA